MIYNLRRAVSRFTSNFNGWKSSRKILVIESDDCGNIRMPNIDTYKFFLSNGYPIADRPFEKYDTLATSEDLSILFDSLKSGSNW